LTNNLPVVDEAYGRRIFSALNEMEVSLDADPIAHGPKRMNAKIAVCRNHLDRCQQIYLQMSSDLHALNRAMRQKKVEFDLQLQDMLTNDPETRAGRSVRDREAVATMKLRNEREEMALIESSISDLDAVMVVVKAKRDDLKDTLGRIRDQLKLCQEEIGLGGRWGSAPAPGQAVPARSESRGIDPMLLANMDEIPSDGEISMSDLDKFVEVSLKVQGRTNEITPVVVPEPVNTPIEYLPDPPAEIIVPKEILSPSVYVALPPATAATADVDSFLDEVVTDSRRASASTSTPAASVSDIDLDDLIGSLV